MERDDRMAESESWDVYQKLILAELQRFDGDIQDLKKGQSEILSEIAILKLKSGLWGALAGAITAVGSGILYLVGSAKH